MQWSKYAIQIIIQQKIAIYYTQQNKQQLMEGQSKVQESKKQRSIKKHQYRSDIDGLRALSVLLVIIFHYFPKQFYGGMFGVDIFFVISGYLISTILYKEHLENTFSFKKFYERRIRRILPSMNFLLISILGISWIFSTKQVIHRFSSMGIASSLMAGNFFLITQPTSVNNIIYHLWSLSIEEQFYLFWPILAGCIIKKRKIWHGILVLSILILFSYGFKIFIEIKYDYNWNIPKNSLTKFWQLLIGCSLAYIQCKKNLDIQRNKCQSIQNQQMQYSPQPTNKKNTLALFTGLIVIIVVCTLYNDKKSYIFTPFVIFGTCLVILFPSKNVVAKYLLESKVSTFIGKISYDLYLWHYPIIKLFGRYDPINDVVQLMTYLGMSILSSEIVQQKIRRNTHPWTVPLILCSSILVFSMLIVSYMFSRPQENNEAPHVHYLRNFMSN